MNRIIFSQDDVKDPIKLERVLQQFRTAVETPIISAPTKFSPQSIDMQSLASQIAKLVQPELQATGSAPLNTQGLLPSGTPAAAIGIPFGTHAARPASSQYPLGTLYYETDRTVMYINTAAGWQYASGMYNNIRTAYPNDLGSLDVGFLFNVTDYVHLVRWSGVAWNLVDQVGGYFIDSAITRGTGYQLCDGTATDYLLDGTTNLAVQPFTTPDETTANPGTYHASAASYSGAINPQITPSISGTVASAVTNVTITAVTSPLTPGGPQLVLDNTTTLLDPSHTHAAGFLLISPTAQPQNMGVLRYFRR